MVNTESCKLPGKKDLKKINDEIFSKMFILEEELKAREQEILEKVDEANRCCAIEAVASDLSENAAYDKAIEDIGKFTSELVDIKAQNDQLNEIIEAYHDYEHAPYVSESSIIHLKSVGVQGISGLKNEYIIKLTANGFNAREYGLIATDTTIGAQLLSKTVGDKISVRDKTFANYKSIYEIVDFY